MGIVSRPRFKNLQDFIFPDLFVPTILFQTASQDIIIFVGVLNAR